MSTTLVGPEIIRTVLDVGQGPAGAPSSVAITAIQYESDDPDARIVGYTKNGVVHTVTYPNATTIVDSGGGVTKTVTLDTFGRPISAILS